uniref:Uncharacterized protein n=1 Tax=Romanomermis culicivorax TaxID=13658 RepID=A0A915JIW4_ROMCU
MLKGFLGGAGAVPPLAIVGVGPTIPTETQQKWPGSEPVPWSNGEVPGTVTIVERLPGWCRSCPTTDQCRAHQNFTKTAAEILEKHDLHAP